MPGREIKIKTPILTKTQPLNFFMVAVYLT